MDFVICPEPTDTSDWIQSSRNQKDNFQLDMGRQLLNAAKSGNEEAVKELVAAGAPFTADWIGTSPLHWTALYNHVEITELLLRSGISHDARNKVERTPLHVACQQGNFEIVKMLLAFGADPNSKDFLRMTPLHWAAEGGNKDVVRILLDHGSFPYHLNKFGKNPSDVAEDRGHYDIIKMIEEMKALPNEERAARIANTKKEFSLLGKKLQLNENLGTQSPKDIQRIAAKRKKLGTAPTKQFHFSIKSDGSDEESSIFCESNGLNTENTLQLLKDMMMLEPDNGTVVSSVVENGHSVELTEAGKLAVNSSQPTTTIHVPKKIKVEVPRTVTVEIPKTATIEVPKTATIEIPKTTAIEVPKTATREVSKTATIEVLKTNTTVEVPKIATVEVTKNGIIEVPKNGTLLIPKNATVEVPKPSSGIIPIHHTKKLPNGKKIIQIKADAFLNMAKEKIVIVKPKFYTRYFEDKLYTNKEELVARLKTRISETEKEVDDLKKKLQEKESEVAKLKSTYDSVIKQSNDNK